VDAAEALAAGLEAGGAEAVAVPVADGGDGTLDVLELALGGERLPARVSAPLGGTVDAEWLLLPDGTAVVESAQALGFQTVAALDPLRASSRGLGELLLAAAAAGGCRALLVCLGGTVTVDGGVGMRSLVEALPLRTRVACDVSSPLLDAAYVFGRQKGASEADVEALAQRLRALELPDVPGAGAARGPARPFPPPAAEPVPRPP